MLNIIDFSGVYKTQAFYKKYPHKYYNFTKMAGVSRYCDDESLKIMEGELILHKPCINYIDSGNYHYLSYLTIAKIKESFSLLLYDNHPDCQAPLYPILSCGSWVYEAAKSLSHLKEVCLIGVEPELMLENKHYIIENNFNELVFEPQSRYYRFVKNGTKQTEQLPIYLSIDKDVLSTDFSATNWSHGNMSLDRLAVSTHQALKNKRLLGIDITGEIDNFVYNIKENALNEGANSYLLKEFYNYFL